MQIFEGVPVEKRQTRMGWSKRSKI